MGFAEARYYNNNHGRFTAVDPLLASGKSANPQTFNRYAYTMNRPLILTDPVGLQAGSPVKPEQATNSSERKISVTGFTYKPVFREIRASYEKTADGPLIKVSGGETIESSSTDVVNTSDAVNEVLTDYATGVYTNELATGVATDSIEGAKGVGTLKSISLTVSVGGEGSSKEVGKVTAGVSGTANFEITDPSDIEQARRKANGDLYNTAANKLGTLKTITTNSPNNPVSLTDNQIKGLLTAAGSIAKKEASKRRNQNKESNDESDKARTRP